MPEHRERPANALAHGPAKPEDIERVRHDVHAAETGDARVERVIDEMEAACQTMQADLRALRRVVADDAPKSRDPS